MSNWKQSFPIVLAGIFLLWALSSFRLPKEKEKQSHAFGAIPVVEKGRTQPFDSYARNVLLLIRERQTAIYEPWKSVFQRQKIEAVDWAMELMFTPEIGDTRPVFRIDHPDIKGLFGFTPEASEAAKTDGKHFSWNALQPHLPDFTAEAQRAFAKKLEHREPYEKELTELAHAINLYKQLKNAFGPAAGGDLAQGLKEYRAKRQAGAEAFQAQRNREPFNPADLEWLSDRFSTLLIVPPHHPEDPKDEWQNALVHVMETERGADPHFSMRSFAEMAAAYRAGDGAGLRKAADDYLAMLGGNAVWEHDVSKASREQRFNFIEPFYKGLYLCVLAFLFALIYWFAPDRLDWLRRAAVYLMVVVFILHSGGLLFRMVHEWRPPVTNLYSSAIFIGLGAVVFGLLLEWIFPHGIGVMMAAVIDFSALFIAHFITLRDGDTMVMLQAVLDTNFWLATHVVIVTLGYTATFLAGFLGLFYVISGAFSNRLAKPLSKREAMEIGALSGGVVGVVAAAAAHDEGKPLGKILGTMIYAIVCFGVLFSFVGTVLGGIWADQSWGRFWGWDVKENGALMIVLWNAIILHARWGGIAKERGIACLAILGNIVTAWSWFGVNNLGIGLHSYGFTNGIMIALLTFVGVQLMIALLGMLACDPECVPRGKKLLTPSDPEPSVPAAT